MLLKRFAVFCCSLLYCTALLAADVSLAWDASVTPTVTGYKVYVGTASRTYGTPTTIGNVTTHTVTGLIAGTYYFAVSAFDAQGNESDYSNEVSQVITGGVLPVTLTITVVPAPGPRVTLLLVPYISTTQATIVWQTDAECSGTAWTSTDQVTWKSVKSNNLGTYDHLSAIVSLIPRTHYYYKVTGTCGATDITSEVRSFNTK
jgi:predicted phage tail protein